MDSKLLKDAIETCIARTDEASTSLEALQFSQAAINLSIAAQNLPYVVAEIHMNDLSPEQIDARVHEAFKLHGARTPEERKWMYLGFLCCQDGYKKR